MKGLNHQKSVGEPEPVEKLIFGIGCAIFPRLLPALLHSHCWATHVRDERAVEGILPASIWASTTTTAIRLRARAASFGAVFASEGGIERDGQKLLILSKGLFHSAGYAPLTGFM